MQMTVIFFSCRRVEILKQSVWYFVENNSYPIAEYIIVNDSGDESIHKQIEEYFIGAKFVFNKENVGLIKSIDLGYQHIKTEYFFHCEDDWCVIKDKFIEKSLTVMRNNPNIEEVWPYPMNGHPVESKIYRAEDVNYRLMKDNYQKGENGINDFGWHGFTTAIGVKRMSDYRKVGPYSEIPWTGTIWHREQAIGEAYHKLGYRAAVLKDIYASNIGIGKSEYKTGYEK
jgi:GT2 family glycosyltransferase